MCTQSINQQELEGKRNAFPLDGVEASSQQITLGAFLETLESGGSKAARGLRRK